jgi:Tol biopolymer transport system component
MMGTMIRLWAGIGACLGLGLVSVLPAQGKLVEKILCAFSEGNSTHILIMDPDGNHQTTLSNGATQNHDPAVSPDGKKIAFISNKANPDPDNPGKTITFDHLFIMNSDGSDERQLTFGWTTASTPCFSPDGSWITFSMSPLKKEGLTYGLHDLYTIGTDGAKFTKITTDPHDDTCPVVTPNGKMIIFSSARAIEPARCAIYGMRTDGATTMLSGKSVGNNPTINRTGTLVIFQGQWQGHGRLFGNRNDGSAPYLIPGEGSYQFPSFGPDGQHLIALTGNSIAQMDSIITMSANGADKRIIFNKPGAHPYSRPIWTYIDLP